MTVAEKLELIAENEQRVYDAGFEKGAAEGGTGMWDEIQDYGNRTDYQYAFRRWNCEYIRPKHKVIPTTACSYMFAYNESLKVLESEYFDLSQATYNATSTSTTNYSLCANCFEMEVFEDIGLQAGYYNQTWTNCRKLKTIHKLRSTKDCKWQNAFLNCYELEEILEIEGEIGQNGFDVSRSEKLSHDTLMRIINALTDYSSEGGTHTITFGAINLAKLTDAEKAIATQKGWSLA